ncbi:MAG: hypothetical protein ACRDRG_18630 [Pseudonocardiaceae bacterium]
MFDGIEIRVLVADVITHPASVLVLKYAQDLYGADEKVATVARLNFTNMPGINRHSLFRAPTGVAADALLFLGVEPLHKFEYREIREFARRALTVTAKEVPNAKEVALTLHGPGYGLDELEAFESEVAGLLDAVREGHVPETLSRITFVERSARRADLMQRTLSQLIESEGPAAQDQKRTTNIERLRSVGYDSRTKSHAFVAMPFNGDFEDHYDYAILPSVRGRGLLCERVDQQKFTGDVIEYMKERISSADIVLAEVSSGNPNVYLEIGFASGKGIPTVLLCGENCNDLAFDIRGQRVIKYGRIKDLEAKLNAELGDLLLPGW